MEQMKYTPERFSPPALNTNTIKRQAIIEQIDNMSKHNILFISAPAGYGKTNVATLWSCGKDVVWISLDEYSASSTDIYKSLLYSLSCEIPKEFNSTQLECTLDLLEKLTNWPNAIIIDDYHLCSDLSVARALPLLRARIPITTCFILLSRNSPPDVLDEQIIKGKIKQITDLRFSCDEIVLLFNKRKIHISKLEAELLYKHTDGWAAVLEVILASYTGRIADMFKRTTLYRYLKSCVVSDYYDNFHILKKCSVCETLNAKLCETVTGEANAWDIIMLIASRTGLVFKINENTYRFHELLKDFLDSELQLDEYIEKPLLYITAANWYKENGNILYGIILAAKSGDIQLLEDYLRIRSIKYGKYEVHNKEYVPVILTNVYGKVPDYIVKRSLCLSSEYFFALFYIGKLYESFEWIDAAKEILKIRENTRTDIIRIAHYSGLDPRKKVWDIPIIFKKISALLSSAIDKKLLNSFSMTLNMPFYHNGPIDYSEISPQLDEFISECDKYVRPVMGSVYSVISLLVEGGICYERGEFTKAEKIASEAIQLSLNFHPEIQFSSMVLQVAVLRAQGKTYNLALIGNMIKEKNAFDLSTNFNAFMCDIQILNGDISAADSWLVRTEVESTLRLCEAYQYFTTARALMATGRLPDALKLLERLTVFSQDYRRGSDFIKALAMQAVCKWYMKRTDEAIELIISAIKKANELQIIMPIVMEGFNVVPILKKILNKLKYGYYANVLNKAFVNTLFTKARAISQYSQEIFDLSRSKPIKLSPKQTEILVYLCQNLSYREISEKTGVQISTVNYHIRRIYEKLGVSNMYDAVAKASELDIGL